MSHSIIYNPEAHAIESKVQGDLTFGEVKEIITEIALLVKEKGCTLILSDYSEATLKLAMIELYELPKIILNTFASSGLKAHRLRRALVASKEVKDFQFFENVTVNRGLNTKVFYDIVEAKKWLYKK